MSATPVRPQGPPDWPGPDPEVAAAVAAALADGSWGRYDGPHVRRLEEHLAVFHAIPHVLTCASGTLAVETALRALGVASGDEVILAAYDYDANFLTVHALDATPVLIDVAAGNWNFDPNQLEATISPRTRAVIVSHLHGGIVPMREVRAIADRHGIAIVEDAAQATGAMVQGRRAGTWGDVGVLSFGGSKLLSAGRGGALLTSRADLQQRIRLALRRGVQQWAALSELQAAALLPQLKRLDERNARRTAAVAWLDELLTGLLGLRRFQNNCECSPVYYKVGFQSEVIDRDRFACAVRAEGVALDPGFRAAHVGRSGRRYRAVGELHEASRAHHGTLILHHPVLVCNEAELAEVATALRRAYANADCLRNDAS